MPQWTIKEKETSFHNYYEKTSLYLNDQDKDSLIKGILITKTIGENISATLTMAIGLRDQGSSRDIFLDKLNRINATADVWPAHSYMQQAEEPGSEDWTYTLADINKESEQSDLDSESASEEIPCWHFNEPEKVSFRASGSTMNLSRINNTRDINNKDYFESLALHKDVKLNYLKLIDSVNSQCSLNRSTYFELCDELNITDVAAMKKATLLNLYKREVFGKKL